MTRRPLFVTIRTEGGLLPSDLLVRVSAGDPDLPGLAASDYHLGKGERLGEAITRSWNRLVGAWTAFQAELETTKTDDPATSLTRERVLLPLLAELGFGRLPAAKGMDVDGARYPVSHAWGTVPIHLVGARIGLDRRTAGVAGAARTSPHSLVQDLLNRSDDHLWGLVSNGLQLRLLRDNSSLTRQAYVEFDLEAMLDGEVYADFVVLWMTAHVSRFESDRPEECLLESWSRAATEHGTRALEQLRAGVESAIVALGQGFLGQPANSPLKERLRVGDLPAQDYYRQLLRTVYRLLFLFAAEDRDLLHTPDTPVAQRRRYLDYYSTTRLRALAERRRGSAHHDLWRALRVVIGGLGQDGLSPLGLPALGSFLWSPEATADLNACELSNRDLLSAVFALGFVRDRREKIARAIDYRNLGAEELGSIYESLLELHPLVEVDASTFSLETAAGHERKVTGSYYTPTSLISELLDSSLDKVLDEAARHDDPEAALLAIKVCDPACGSGHFLIAAANRIARRVAMVRTGDPEPGPDAMRHALRDVIGRCVYGIDQNPMAVELCKVSMWLEALEPGKPLSFLDHRIAVGNSLLGTTPKLIEAGIPDGAFKPLPGDDKRIVTELKKRNRLEREGQATLDLGPSIDLLAGPIAAEVRAIDAIADETLDSIREKEERWRKLIEGAEVAQAKLLADAWCAAFVIPKSAGAPAITQDTIDRLRSGPERVGTDVREAIQEAAHRYRFLHWHLAFPDVFTLDGEGAHNPDTGWYGGFNLVCGNPPWEQVQLSEQEFFATRAPNIANAQKSSERKRMIRALQQEDSRLWRDYEVALRDADAERHFLGASGRYPLCGRGRINLYAVFAEVMHHGIAEQGFAAAVLPLGIATDFTTADFFRGLVDRRSLVSLYGFENEEFVFPEVHHGTKFCLLTVAGPAHTIEAADLCFFLRQTSWLVDTWRHFVLTPDEFELLNPNTGTCPVFRSERDAEITKQMYRQTGILVHESKGDDGNPWGLSFRQGLFNMASDSELFRVRESLEADDYEIEGNVFISGLERALPLYEAKMVHLYDHRFGTYEGQTQAQANQSKLPEFTDVDHSDPSKVPLSRYWVLASEVDKRLADHDWNHDWLIGWRDVTNTTNERSVIAAAIPRVAVGHKFPLMMPRRHPQALIAMLSSYALDYAARQKIGGTSLTFFILKQLPVLPPDKFDSRCPWDAGSTLADWIRERVLELVYTSHDVASFAKDLGYEGPPFQWDSDRRAKLRAELDAAFFHLYGIDRDNVDYVMDTFNVARRKEEAKYGIYRTKQLVLDYYDDFDKAAQSVPSR